MLVAWAISRSRTVFSGPLVSLTTEKSTLAGGVGVGSHRKMSISATPRLVGELRPGWENMDSMLTWVTIAAAARNPAEIHRAPIRRSKVKGSW